MTSDKAIFVLHPEHKNLKRGELPAGFIQISDDNNQRRGCLFIMLLVLCNLLVLLPVIHMAVSDIYLSKRFLDDGRHVAAQVITCNMVRTNKRYRPEVTFSYIIDGVVYQQNQLFTKDCSLYSPGQMLSGIYLPDEPTQIRFGEQPETMVHIVVNKLPYFLIMGCALVFIATIVIGIIYSIGDALRGLYPTGVAREGRITKIYREKEDLFVVEYRFKISSERSIKGRDEARRPDIIGIPLPEVGTPVTVLYSDRNQHRLM